MNLGRALLVAAAAMLVAGCGALGFPEARAPLTASAHPKCKERQAAAQPAQPSTQAYSALMP